MLPVAVAQSFCDGSAVRHALSACVDDVKFSHNGANRPELKMARMICLVRQAVAPGRSLPSPTPCCLFCFRLLVF